MEQNLITEVLAYLVKNPPEVVNIRKLEFILDNEDYIIFYYLKNLRVDNINLSKSFLEFHLNADAHVWFGESYRTELNGRDEIYRKIEKDYIQSRVEGTLVTTTDFKDALIELVVDRYEELLTMRIPSNFKLDSYKDPINIELKKELGNKIIQEVVGVSSSEDGYWHNGKLYRKDDVFPYLKDRIREIDVTEEQINDNYTDGINTAFIEEAKSHIKAFKWNLGKYLQIPELAKGYVLSLIGLPKAGKTTFAIGEIVYPMLVLGRNIAYYSCEMSRTQIYSKLISKHIWVKNSLKVDPNIISSYLAIFIYKNTYEKDDEYLAKIVAEGRRRDLANKGKHLDTEPFLPEDEYFKVYQLKSSIETYFRVPGDLANVISENYNELFQSGRYGKLLVVREDNMSDGEAFVVEEMSNFARIIKKKFNGELDAIVYDHAGYFKSVTGKNKTAILTEVYQNAKGIAEDKSNPLLVCVVNHMKEASESNMASARAYGTSEAEKSADVGISLFITDVDRRDGLVTMAIPISRHEGAPEEPIKLIADRQVCDFVATSDKKEEYPEII